MSDNKSLYLDGDFTDELSGTSYQSLYTSSYSSGILSCTQLEVSPDVQKTLSARVFDDIIQFYNENIAHFKRVEDKLHVNFWFLEHFRLYFTCLNFFLKLECIRNFLDIHKDGIILTSDPNLTYFIDTRNLRFIPPRKKRSPNAKVLMREAYRILSSFRFPAWNPTPILLLSRTSDRVTGHDKYLWQLEPFFTKVYNRPLFDRQQHKPQAAGSDPILTTDHIFCRYVLQGTWLKDLAEVRSTLRQLQQHLLNSVNQSSGTDKAINCFFWSNRQSLSIYYLRFKSFDHFFKRHRSTGVLLTDENSPQQKVIQYAAAANTVKSFAVQHGAIHDLHPAYIYGRYVEKPLLPDITFTWGDYFTELLTTRGGYPVSRVFTSGRPIPEYPNRARHPDIDDRKKLIVYASQPQRDPHLRRQQCLDVMIAAQRSHQRYQLVIRPHPAETDDQYFLSLGDELRFQSYLIDRISDLQTHLEVCDLLITSFSTVGTEVIPFYKPLLVLDYLSQDLNGWIREGVGIRIRNQGELIQALSAGQFELNRQSYDNFVRSYFYSTDGKAAERIKARIHGD